jgi:hypothetical protein
MNTQAVQFDSPPMPKTFRFIFHTPGMNYKWITTLLNARTVTINKGGKKTKKDCRLGSLGSFRKDHRTSSPLKSQSQV